MTEEQKETEAQRVKRQLAKRDLINQGLDEYFSSFHGRFIVASALNIGINIICSRCSEVNTQMRRHKPSHSTVTLPLR